MKVLLIYPPAFHMITTNIPDVVDDEMGAYPPLGLMYVAAYALRYTDHEIRILDTQVDGLDYEDIRRAVASYAPDVVGLQAMTFTLIDAIKTAQIIKEVSPEIHVTVGGPHCNIFPQETLAIDVVDSIVLGEGEVSFTALLQGLGDGKDLSQVRGIGYKENGQVRLTPGLPLLESLDDLPYPARHLLPYEQYYSVLSKFKPVTTMMTSRGCPYQCVFCDRPYLGKDFRYRSAINVVGEMEECLTKFGIKEIMVYDDTFSINKQRVHDICDEIVRQDLPVKWDIRTSVNAVDEKMLRNLARAGCQRIHYGIESSNADIQVVIKKFLNIDRVKRCVQLTGDLGMETLGYFMIGNPTETREQIEQSIEFARGISLDYAHISIHTPFPATESYRMGFEKGLYSNDYWRDFARNPREGFVPRVWDEVLSREELISLMHRFYQRFYMRPSYMLERLYKLRSAGELKRKAKMGLRLLSRLNPMALAKSREEVPEAVMQR